MYVHGEIRNKYCSWKIEETTSHNARSSAVFNITLERKGKTKLLQHGYSYLVTHPGTNRTLWYSYYERIFYL